MAEWFAQCHPSFQDEGSSTLYNRRDRFFSSVLFAPSLHNPFAICAIFHASEQCRLHKEIAHLGQTRRKHSQSACAEKMRLWIAVKDESSKSLFFETFRHVNFFSLSQASYFFRSPTRRSKFPSLSTVDLQEPRRERSGTVRGQAHNAESPPKKVQSLRICSNAWRPQ